MGIKLSNDKDPLFPKNPLRSGNKGSKGKPASDRDPKRPTIYAKGTGTGIKRIFEDKISADRNFSTDMYRGLLNMGSAAGDFLRSNKPGTTAAGSELFGKQIVLTPVPGKDRPSAEDARRNQADAVGVKRRAPGTVAGQDFPPDQKTFADFLAEAQSLLGSSSGGSGGPDYSAMEANLRGNAASGDAKLEAMFRQLRGSIDADAAGIGQNYDTTAASIKQNSDQGAAVVNQGYNSATAASDQQDAALGISGTARSDAAGADQAIAQSNIAQNSVANQNLVQQNKASSLNYNTGIGNAAGLAGATERAALQQQLASKLAELQVAKSQGSSDNADRAYSQRKDTLEFAQGLQDRNDAANAPANPQDGLDAAKTAAETQNIALKNASLQAILEKSTGGGMAFYQAEAQKAGFDPANMEEMVAFVDLFKSMQT